MVLVAAGVDRERAQVELTQALNSNDAPGQVPALFTADEISGLLDKVGTCLTVLLNQIS